MRALLLGLFSGLAGAVQATPIAEIICEATPDMMTRLETRMHSTRTAVGMRNAEQLMEIWEDPRGDWVLVASYASGTSCIVAMGENWQALTPVAAEPS